MSNIDDARDANLSRLLLHDFDFVEESFEMVKRKASEAIAEIKEARNEFEKLMLLPQGIGSGDSQFQELKKKVSKLKSSIPFNLIIPVDPPHPNVNFLPRYNPLRTQKGRTQNIVVGEGSGGGGGSPYSASGRFPPPTYHELESGVRNLKILEISCLLCFLTFPESAFIKRSILLCWVRSFRSPGFYDPSFAIDLNQVIEELIEKGLIISVIKKSSLAVSGYRMHPFVHFTLRNSHTWFPVYLSYKPLWYLGRSLDNDDDEYIYYTTESYALPSLSCRKLEILYLGRWKNFTTQHIEVIDQKLFFKDMHKLSNLRFVSLRGISMIEELPKFIVELTKLKILDLKACYNLMVIPSDIANLQHSLTHLDMSECYFLDHMPKAIATLRKLQVLKGFFVGETEDERSCTIEDLKRFQVLSKLNIYTRLKEFPNRSQLRTLELLQQLRSLTISWVGCAVSTSGTQKTFQGEENGLKPCDSQLEQVSLMSESIFSGDEIYVFKLEKLDLQCVPDTVTEWLKPARFRKLKKLYIRGGPFNDLGQASRSNRWNVKILRLKHLSKLNFNWVELELLFPKLERLENVNCPNLDSFPCDKDGVWIKSTRQKI